MRSPLRLPVLAAALFAAAAGTGRAADDAALFSPAMLNLRTTLSNDLATARSATLAAGGEVLKAETARWENDLAERRRTRNIKGIAVADAALDALKAASAALEKKGTVEFPANLRRELAEDFARLKTRIDAAEREASAAIAAAETKAVAAFRDAAQKAGVEVDADPATAKKRFDTWLTATPPAAGAAAPGPAGTVATPAPVEAVPASPEPPPEFFAQSRPGADWVTVGRWTAESTGPDVFEIAAFAGTGKKSGRKDNPIVGRATEWSYEGLRKLDPGDYAFRLRRIDKRDVVEIVEWPGPANEGRLTFRTKIVRMIPAPTGFELQCSTAKPVSVPVKTEPAGARVFVDGRAYLEGGREARTPCTLNLPAGTYSLRIALEGHQDLEAKEYVVAEGRAIGARLSPLKDMPGRTVKVDPLRIWADTGVTVNKGDRIRLSVDGEWGCGKQGELTGPAGYDPSQLKFSHYYMNPRNGPKQIDGAPYGALLVRIGTNKISHIGTLRGFIAGNAGPLLFDVNEEADPAWRRDNRGALQIKVIAGPAAP